MSDVKAKMHQIWFRLVYSAPPDPLAGFKGPTSKEMEGRERRGSGGEGRRGKGREEGRGGREGEEGGKGM